MAMAMETTMPRKPCPLESVEQCKLAQWLDARGVLWTHVPNEGKRKPRTGATLKRMGLKRGVPDVLIFSHPKIGTDMSRIISGAAIELKRQYGGKPTDEQIEWLDQLDQLGWAARVCNGADAAIEWLEELGY